MTATHLRQVTRQQFFRGLGIRDADRTEYLSMPALDTVSDEQLVVAIARSREDALAEAYRRHGGAVFGLAKRVTGSVKDAEDITQDLFVRLWSEPERYDAARGSLRTFLLNRTHGRAVDVVRARTSRETREERDARETASAPYDLERQVWDLALADLVSRALDSLPEEERRSIELAYFDGRSYREVAVLLAEPEGTIKSRIRNGLRRMRASLREHGVEEFR
jgi:RNA polymerase sigma-70 factor (ECF subfamily)